MVGRSETFNVQRSTSNEQLLAVADRPGEVGFFFGSIAERLFCDHPAVLERVNRITRHALRSMHKDAVGRKTRLSDVAPL